MPTAFSARRMATGGMVCKHCGGAVDADGYSEGGMVDDEAEEMRHGEMEPVDQNGDEYERPMPVSDDSPQRADAERMRRFAMAVKGRR